MQTIPAIEYFEHKAYVEQSSVAPSVLTVFLAVVALWAAFVLVGLIIRRRNRNRAAATNLRAEADSYLESHKSYGWGEPCEGRR